MKTFKFKLLLFFILINSTYSQQSGWQTQINPLGYGEAAMLGRVEFVSPTEGWISGSRGTLLHTTDSGTNWILVNPFPDDTLWSGSDPGFVMDWVNPNYGWKIENLGPAYGESKKVFLHKTTDGGNTWTRKILSETEGDAAVRIQFVDVNTGWVLIFNFGTMTPTFLKTIDGGENWFPFFGAGIFFFVNANTGWSYYATGPQMTTPYKIMKTTDGGNNWTEQFSDAIEGQYNEIYFSDENNGWIVGDKGKVLKTTNGGDDWTYVTNTGINPDQRSKTVFFLDKNNGWIPSKTSGNESAFICHTTDGGGTWNTETLPLGSSGSNAVFSINFVNSQTGWLTSDWGRICKFTGTTDIREGNHNIESFKLFQNFPNPFNPETLIEYFVPYDSFIEIKVYDILARELTRLVNEEKPAGKYQIKFDGTNYSSGIYLYQISNGKFSVTKKCY